MPTLAESEIEDVLSFWYGSRDDAGFSDAETKKRWWKKDPTFDAEVRARFLPLFERLIQEGTDEFLPGSAAAMAAIVVLDQFSRNMFRDSPKMYDGDAIAVSLVQRIVASGKDLAYTGDHRTQVYMPLMHSEALADQDAALACYEKMLDDVPVEKREDIESRVRYAHLHRDIVVRFGRFPHRNEILGRTSTEEEIAFLKEPGSRF